MSSMIDREKLEAMAKELAMDIRTEKDLSDLSRALMKLTVETALGAELEAHLGYAKHDPSGRNSGNSRNGVSSKRLQGAHGEVEIDTPRDRNGDFEPLLVRKGQTRLTQFDDQILSLYAKGMSTRDIVAAFQEMYGAQVSPTLVSKVTESVLERVVASQSRPLDELYPSVYLDCIVVKVRQDKRVINKAVYLALGINLEGNKELLGLWLAATEGGKLKRSGSVFLIARGHAPPHPNSSGRYSLARCGA